MSTTCNCETPELEKSGLAVVQRKTSEGRNVLRNWSPNCTQILLKFFLAPVLLDI